MTYKELQQALKQFKVEGLTSVKLNASQEVLQAEYTQVIEQIEIDKQQQTKDGLLAVDRFIEIVEKTLTVNLYCDYKINCSMILENKEITFNELISKIAKDADVNRIDLLLAVEQNMEYDFSFNLTDYRYNSIEYFLEVFIFHVVTIEKRLKEITPPVLEIVTPENDPSLDTAIKSFTKAINHVFKRFGSNNFTTEESLRLSMGNEVTVNDFIKFLNLNTGFDLTEFMEYLEYHLEDQYQYLIQYSSIDYGKYPLKMILQDFAYSIDVYQLIA
jgi:hypothetical protein